MIFRYLIMADVNNQVRKYLKLHYLAGARWPQRTSGCLPGCTRPSVRYMTRITLCLSLTAAW